MTNQLCDAGTLTDVFNLEKIHYFQTKKVNLVMSLPSFITHANLNDVDVSLLENKTSTQKDLLLQFVTGRNFCTSLSDEQNVQIGIGKRPDLYKFESMCIFESER